MELSEFSFRLRFEFLRSFAVSGWPGSSTTNMSGPFRSKNVAKRVSWRWANVVLAKFGFANVNQGWQIRLAKMRSRLGRTPDK